LSNRFKPTAGRAIRQPSATAWTAAQLGLLTADRAVCAPLIAPADLAAADPQCGLWDAWPATRTDGALFQTEDGARLWFALAAPRADDPDARHAVARIHLLVERQGRWHDRGPAMPDGFSPGSREWSGSAVVHADGAALTLFFTAAGHRGEAQCSFAQRLFQATATLRIESGLPALTGWRDLKESIRRDAAYYMDPEGGCGSIGTIKAFRDPGYFHDAATKRAFLFFTASLTGTESPFNGAIGAAYAADGLSDWTILPPLITATGLNNELERPHVVRHQGLHYLFWSTQAHVFDPLAPAGPTGLYGMVSDDLLSGWQPLNGSGLVFANPPSAPRQAYSWLVLPDLMVTSFIDDWGRGTDCAQTRRFGGTFAPWLALELDGSYAGLRLGR
jgi:levansucrase